MKTILKVIVVLCFFVGSSLAQDQTFIDKLDNYLGELSKDELFSLSVAVAQGDSIVFKKAFGEAHRGLHVANTPETRFNIASIGKMFTAVAILQLQDQGKLDVQEKVARYFPDFPNEAIREASIHQLLTHTSGLPIWFSQEFVNSSKFQYQSLRDYLPLIKAAKIDPDKVGKYGYSNIGYFVLGYLIEKITGMPYGMYIAQNITIPLEMYGTDNWNLGYIIDNAATGYMRPTKDGDVWKSNEQLNMGGGPAGGAYATSSDLLKFIIGLRNHRLLSPESTALMLSPKVKNDSGSYGYGISIWEEDGQEVLGHLGGFYGIRGEVKWYKNADYTVAVLANSDQTDYIDLSHFINVSLRGTVTQQEAHLATQELITNVLAGKVGPRIKNIEELDIAKTFDESLIQIKAYYHLNRHNYKKAILLFKLNGLLFSSEQTKRDLKMAEARAESREEWKAW